VQAVKWDKYNAALKQMGVLVKAKNFLVFQGDVESIAQKVPKQLAALVSLALVMVERMPDALLRACSSNWCRAQPI
jgi:predicted dinucleotide-utilizing enzyme